jgi:hypothetical protein
MVRLAALRSQCLSLAKNCSMGSGRASISGPETARARQQQIGRLSRSVPLFTRAGQIDIAGQGMGFGKSQCWILWPASPGKSGFRFLRKDHAQQKARWRFLLTHPSSTPYSPVNIRTIPLSGQRKTSFDIFPERMPGCTTPSPGPKRSTG